MDVEGLSQSDLVEVCEQYLGQASPLVVQLRRMNDRLDSMDKRGVDYGIK